MEGRREKGSLSGGGCSAAKQTRIDEDRQSHQRSSVRNNQTLPPHCLLLFNAIVGIMSDSRTAREWNDDRARIISINAAACWPLNLPTRSNIPRKRGNKTPPPWANVYRSVVDHPVVDRIGVKIAGFISGRRARMRASDRDIRACHS